MKRVISAIATITLTTGLLAAGPTASAAGECPNRNNPVSDAYAPQQDVVLGPGDATEITVGMAGWSGCFDLFPPSLEVHTPVRAFAVDLTGGPDEVGYSRLSATIRVDAGELANADAGEWVFDFDVAGAAGEARAVNVKRATRLSFDAGPEPLRRHHRLTFRGALRAADWERGAYRGLRGQEVAVYAVDGQTLPTWEPLAVLQTRRHGRYRVRAEVPGPNRFEAVYQGTDALDHVTSRVDTVVGLR